MSFGVNLFVGVLSIQRKSSMDKDFSGRNIFSVTFQSWARKIFHHSAKKMRKLNRNCIQRAQKKNWGNFCWEDFFSEFYWIWGNIFHVLVKQSFSVGLSKVPDSFSEKIFGDDFLWQSSISFETLLDVDQKNFVLGKIFLLDCRNCLQGVLSWCWDETFWDDSAVLKKFSKLSETIKDSLRKHFGCVLETAFYVCRGTKWTTKFVLKKKPFFPIFFLISTGLFLKFCPKSIGRILKTAFIKSRSIFLTKILWDHLFFWVDFGLWAKQSWVFGWKLLTCLSKMHSYCSEFWVWDGYSVLRFLDFKRNCFDFRKIFSWLAKPSTRPDWKFEKH